MSNYGDPEERSILFERLGGEAMCHRLAHAFYARVPDDPLLNRVYRNPRPQPPDSLSCPAKVLADFFTQFLGGPEAYVPHRWSLSLREAHQRFKIGPQEREAWLRTMRASLEDLPLEAAARDVLYRLFEQMSAQMVNLPEGETRQEPSGEASEGTVLDPRFAVITGQGESLRVLDEIVAAVRTGQTEQAIAQIESAPMQAFFARDRAALVSLFAMMSGSETAAMIDYVCRHLRRNPEMMQARVLRGGTMLHLVAEAGSVPVTELLLELGADPDARNAFGQTPLYAVGNGCQASGAGEVVRILARAGANLDAPDEVKRCTALHMAARRGNVAVAKALLEAGANVEVRDRNGETPLRRAVNCGKTEVAALLLRHGADAMAQDRAGKTPWQAARSAAMKAILEPSLPI